MIFVAAKKIENAALAMYPEFLEKLVWGSQGHWRLRRSSRTSHTFAWSSRSWTKAYETLVSRRTAGPKSPRAARAKPQKRMSARRRRTRQAKVRLQRKPQAATATATCARRRRQQPILGSRASTASAERATPLARTPMSRQSKPAPPRARPNPSLNPRPAPAGVVSRSSGTV